MRQRTGIPTLALAFALVLVSWSPGVSRAQNGGGDVDLLLLQAPPSPAYVLLGVEPASVERPGEPTDVGFSLLTATDDLSVLPANYALSLAPYWLFGGGKKLTHDEWARGSGFGSTMLQTLDISIAAASSDELQEDGETILTTSLGAGFRVSLARGKVAESRLDTAIVALGAAQKIAARVANDRIFELQQTDPVLAELEQRLLDRDNLLDEIEKLKQQIAARNQFIADQVEAELQESHFGELRRLASQIRMRREGFKLDLAGGLTYDFPGRDVDARQQGQAGLWLTGGYERRHWAGLLVVRWLTTNVPELGVKAASDYGIRVLFDDNDRFALSAEALGRWFTDDALEDTWRASLIADYRFNGNRTLSVSFGRDFEGQLSGNLIAAVQLLLGFGSGRGGMLGSG